jgi:hypothetical protein
MTDKHELMTAGIGFVAGLGTSWLLGLRGKISDIILSRSGGLRIHTNSPMIVFELMGKIEQIDSETKKEMRKATEALTIMPLKKFGMKTEVMLFNFMANRPLLNASHENHITREIKDSGADKYITEKIDEVLSEVQFWAQQFPELPEMVESFVYLWTKRVLIPNIRRSCNDKLAYYRKLYSRTNIIDSLREEVLVWIKKNEEYLECLEELNERSVIREQTHITKISAIAKKENSPEKQKGEQT